jgi:D-alanyl-D-alanine carboxypeptidase
MVVVLGAPTAKARNQKTTDLFDRGFAMSGGSDSLESQPSGSGAAPNMRADVCLHRSSAAIAAEDDGVSTPALTAGSAGAAMPANPLAALFAPVALTLKVAGKELFRSLPGV